MGNKGEDEILAELTLNTFEKSNATNKPESDLGNDTKELMFYSNASFKFTSSSDADKTDDGREDFEDNDRILRNMHQRRASIVIIANVTTLAGQANKPGLQDGIGKHAIFSSPMGLTEHIDGSLLVADVGNHVIRRVNLDTAEVETWIGRFSGGRGGYKDGRKEKARFVAPMDVECDEYGRVFVADTGNDKIRMITGGGREPCNFAASSQTFQINAKNKELSSDTFGSPRAVAVFNGTVFVADEIRNKIRRIEPDGRVSAVKIMNPLSCGVDRDGNILTTDRYTENGESTHTIVKVL